ncbi:MAG: hypothetical protein Q4F30_04285 [Akkermansia sp.]|nr:hypothetical protein [Akkermansia sp.]
MTTKTLNIDKADGSPTIEEDLDALPTRVPEEQYITAELEAVKQALMESVDREVYERLREGSDYVIKLSFSVTVDRGQMEVDAKMTGALKMEKRAQSFITDPAQMELGL